MIKISNIHKGEILAVLSGLMYGLVGYFGVQIISLGNTVPNMSAWRYMVATLIILIILIPRYKTISINLKDALRLLTYGTIFYAPCSILYFYSCQYINTGVAMVIFFSSPAVVILLNRILYNSKLNKLYYLSVATIFIGLVLLTDFDDAQLNFTGIMLAIGASVGYGCYITACQDTNQLDPIISTMIVTFGCTILGLITSAIEGSLHIPETSNEWMNIFNMALITTVFPILLLFKSMQYISGTKAAILSVLEPVFVVIFGMILLDETVTIQQGIGLVIVLGGALIALQCKK